MAGKLLRNTLTGKTRNRDAKAHKQALDLSSDYSDFRSAVNQTGMNIFKTDSSII